MGIHGRFPRDLEGGDLLDNLDIGGEGLSVIHNQFLAFRDVEIVMCFSYFYFFFLILKVF